MRSLDEDARRATFVVHVNRSSALFWTRYTFTYTQWEKFDSTESRAPLPDEASIAKTILALADAASTEGTGGFLRFDHAWDHAAARQIIHAIANDQTEFVDGAAFHSFARATVNVPPAFVLAALALLLVRAIRKAQLRAVVAIIDSHSCASCRYDFTGLDPGSLCPECGTDNQAVRRKICDELS